MSQSKLRIRLGPGWSAFVPQPVDIRLLGVVQRDLQIGALAQCHDGSYVQINGDVVQPLNRSQVEHALRASAQAGPNVSGTPAPPPAVTVRKRRRFAPDPSLPPAESGHGAGRASTEPSHGHREPARPAPSATALRLRSRANTSAG